MAATSITYTRVQSTVTGPPALYQVQATVTATVNIDDAVFVYRYSDGLYDHIATVLDMQTYPDVSTPAIPFYRQATVLKQFEAANEAVDFSETIASRLTSLAQEYDIVAATFVLGTVPITVPVP
jgi:hypothetical protein